LGPHRARQPSARAGNPAALSGYRAGMDGVLLRRFVEHRGIAMPPLERLRDVAPDIGVRAADLLAIAGLRVPADLMPADPTAKVQVRSVVRHAGRLDAGEVHAVCEYAGGLPAWPDARPEAAPPQASATFGELLAQLMRVRNLDVGTVARAAWFAESLITRLILGLHEPKAEWLVCIGDVFGVNADDLTALAGLPAPTADDYENAEKVGFRSGIGELICTLTPLSAAAIGRVAAYAHDLAARRSAQ
jgi:hypothetical protein